MTGGSCHSGPWHRHVKKREPLHTGKRATLPDGGASGQAYVKGGRSELLELVLAIPETLRPLHALARLRLGYRAAELAKLWLGLAMRRAPCAMRHAHVCVRMCARLSRSGCSARRVVKQPPKDETDQERM